MCALWLSKVKNELERFTDKCGKNKIWAVLTQWIADNGDRLDIDGYDIKLDDTDTKFTRNLHVMGCCFTYDAIIEAYIAYSILDGQDRRDSELERQLISDCLDDDI